MKIRLDPSTPRRATPRKDGLSVEVRVDAALQIDTGIASFRPVADAYRDAIARSIDGITDSPAESTVRRRGPGSLYNVTGTLIRDLSVELAGETFVIGAGTTRLDQKDDYVRERLAQLTGGAAAWGRDTGVQRALKTAMATRVVRRVPSRR